MVGGAHPTTAASRSSLRQSRRAEKDSGLNLPSSCLHFWNRGRFSRWATGGKTSNFNGFLIVVECTINVGFHRNIGAFGEGRSEIWLIYEGQKKQMGAVPTLRLQRAGGSLLQSGCAEKDSGLNLPSSCLHFWNRGRLSRGATGESPLILVAV